MCPSERRESRPDGRSELGREPTSASLFDHLVDTSKQSGRIEKATMK
jgi:hypothetical protein